jgi:hypothetical protein
MSNKADLEKDWKFKLEQWKNSGLSGFLWCREQNIKYCVFLYWKKKLKTLEAKSDHFLELVEPSSTITEIKIEFQGFVVRLTKDFDETTFQRCVQLLRGL